VERLVDTFKEHKSLLVFFGDVVESSGDWNTSQARFVALFLVSIAASF
jgi:hypothetical protein